MNCNMYEVSALTMFTQTLFCDILSEPTKNKTMTDLKNLRCQHEYKQSYILTVVKKINTSN